VKKTNSSRTFIRTSILHTSPNFPSQPPFLEALQNVRPTIFFFFVFSFYYSAPRSSNRPSALSLHLHLSRRRQYVCGLRWHRPSPPVSLSRSSPPPPTHLVAPRCSCAGARAHSWRLWRGSRSPRRRPSHNSSTSEPPQGVASARTRRRAARAPLRPCSASRSRPRRPRHSVAPSTTPPRRSRPRGVRGDAPEQAPPHERQLRNNQTRTSYWDKEN
jgi:hypothetical protein